MVLKGREDVAITYHIPLFGEITHDFLLVQKWVKPWLKERFTRLPHNYY